MLSRLYLGVHSPADLVAGGIIGVMFLSFYIVTDDYIDYYTRTSVFGIDIAFKSALITFMPQILIGFFAAPLQLIIFVSFLLWIHPRSNPETQSYGESVSFINAFLLTRGTVVLD